MLTKIEIENFKSIYKESIELGRVNVFIGENGCGKTNILEAVGMASAVSNGKYSNTDLSIKGIRVTKPSITASSFFDVKQKKLILIGCFYFDEINKNEITLPFLFTTKDNDDINSVWINSAELIMEEAYKLGFLEGKKDSTEKNKENIELPENVNKVVKRILLEEYFSKTTLPQFIIYNLSTNILRGIGGNNLEIPGIHGENLDVLIARLSKEEFQELLEHSHFISWLEKIEIDREGGLRLQGHNLNLSQSKLYFRDKFMQKKNNIFSAENANEGILHILFYLALFISKRTPNFFAIDNIETALNPALCRALMVELIKLAKKNDKQVLITTHNPAILDGLNLHDDEVRLFTVSRNLKGHTKVKRIEIKPDVELNGHRLKLSELWMRGHLGAIPHHF